MRVAAPAMQGSDVLLTIAEVAVAFAGFASIAVLFQHRDPRQWPPEVVVRLRTMIESSLATLFTALLPFALFHLGLADQALWAASSLLLALILVGYGGRVWALSRRSLAAGRLSRAFTATNGAIALLLTVALLLNSAGVLFQRSFGPYLVAVLWNLGFTSLMFLRVVVVPNRSSDLD